jgi:hypothetical protein
MAYAATPAAPRSRPSTVTAALWLLYLYVALAVVGAGIWAANFSAFRDAFTNAFRNSDAADAASAIAVVTVVIGAGIPLLFGIVLLVFGMLAGKGRNWARIVTWVVGGIGVCCSGASLIQNAVGSSMNFRSNNGANMPTQEEIQRAVEQSVPSWFGPTLAVIGIVGLLALLASLILFALPASNAFYRKPAEPAWEPPLPPPPAAA